MNSDGTIVTAKLAADFRPAMAKAILNAPQAIDAANNRTRTINNMKQIGIAIHGFHDVNGKMPTDILDANGKPILSWRVQLLPYLEQGHLYQQFDVTKPWDDPKNKKLLEQMPSQYRVYGRETKEKDLTYLQMPTSDKPLEWGSPMKVRGQKITLYNTTDGLSNTFMVVETADPVLWTKPDDVVYDPKKLPKLGGSNVDRFLALFGDGSVRVFKKSDISDAMLKALFTRDGGEVVNIP